MSFVLSDTISLVISFATFCMCQCMQIQIDNPDVQALQRDFTPTFEIVNRGRSYVCNPRPAVDKAHIVFQAFSASRLFGSIQMDVADPHDVLADIVSWLHGGKLRIDKTKVVHLKQFAEILEIPLLLKWTEIFLKSQFMMKPGG